MIPMEELDGRANATAIVSLVHSAASAHFNMLRVWGGGIYQYRLWYDECDRRGLMVYQDMMYAQLGHAPASSPTQLAELAYQVQQLSHHPCIVVWDGCNECGGQGVYQSFVMTAVASLDQARPIWPSCPSTGWLSGADRLWARPNGEVLSAANDPNNGAGIETHGPYQHGTGFVTVNDPTGELLPFPANIPPLLLPEPACGPAEPGVFASEFGCVAWSSLEAMTATLPSSSWGLHTPQMYQRNYPCDNIIAAYWGPQDLAPVGLTAFARQLYQCNIGSALNLKSNIETRRSGNEWGTLVWQLNEIWPTGGWGSIEYGSSRPGMVIGGRWKPLHYLYRQHLYADVLATCGTNGTCYVKNDGIWAFSGAVLGSLVQFSSGKTIDVLDLKVELAPGAGVIQWFCLDQACASIPEYLAGFGCTPQTCSLELEVVSKGSTVSFNSVAFVPPGNLTLPQATVVASVQKEGDSLYVHLSSSAVAMYVTLTSQAQGKFAENMFLLLPHQTKIVGFVPFDPYPADYQLLKTTLRVEHVALYQ